MPSLLTAIHNHAVEVNSMTYRAQQAAMRMYHQQLSQMSMINQLKLCEQLANSTLWTENLNNLDSSFDVGQMNNFWNNSLIQFQQMVTQQNS